MDKPFIGMGNSPDGIDMPVGLGMQLGMHPRAMEAFGRLSDQERVEIVNYVQSATTGDEAKSNISNTISRLEGYNSDIR